MTNRILQLQVIDRSLDPAQAEVWFVVQAEHRGPTTELRGRLAGPRCVYAATVEVGYPLRPLLRRPEGLTGLAARVVIPEASLWEPACPFLYEGSVELWQDGRCCDQAPVRHGLRRILLGQAGLRVNGEALTLQGRELKTCDAAQASELRRAGCNLLVAPANGALYELADVQGFFVLDRLQGPNEAWRPEATRHPSCLGWLLTRAWEQWDGFAFPKGALVGVELDALPTTPAPDWVDFIACPAGIAATLCGLGLPLLILDGSSDAPGVFGKVV